MDPKSGRASVSRKPLYVGLVVFLACLALLKFFPIPEHPERPPPPARAFAADLSGIFPPPPPPLHTAPSPDRDGTPTVRQASSDVVSLVRETDRVISYRAKPHAREGHGDFVAPETLGGEGATFRQGAFRQVFQRSTWGDGVKVPKSGAGSTKGYTKGARAILMEVVVRHGITSMLDIPCGDMTWMPLFLEEVRAVDPNFTYIGADIVPELVEANRRRLPDLRFEVLDLVSSALPRVDLIFCRDVLQHLPIADVKRGIKNMSNSGSTYLLTTTYPRQSEVMNRQEIDLQRRGGATVHRDLIRPPFSVQDPLVMYSEQREHHKFLALWKTPINFDPTSSV